MEKEQTKQKAAFTHLRNAAKEWLEANSETGEINFKGQDMLLAFEGGAMWHKSNSTPSQLQQENETSKTLLSETVWRFNGHEKNEHQVRVIKEIQSFLKTGKAPTIQELTDNSNSLGKATDLLLQENKELKEANKILANTMKVLVDEKNELNEQRDELMKRNELLVEKLKQAHSSINSEHFPQLLESIRELTATKQD